MSWKSVRRRGAIAVQTGLLLVATLSIIACACDVGWIVMTRTQLQVAADAGALAGGTAFMRGLGTNPLSPSTIASAVRQYASEYTARHRNGELGTSYIDTTRDVEVGWAVFNPALNKWNLQFNATLPVAGGYNMVRVTMHRDQSASALGDRPLPLVLGPAIGRQRSNVSAFATAVLVPANGIRIEPNNDMTGNMIPFTLALENWQKFFLAQRYWDSNGQTAPNPPESVLADMSNLSKGWYRPSTGMWHNPPAAATLGPPPTRPEPLFGHYQMSSIGNPTYVEDFEDGYTYNSSGVVSNGKNGKLEIDIYPKDDYTSGNFGTIDIGSSANESSVVKRQILDGVTAQDLSHYPNNEFKLPRTTTGDTGISAGFKAELEAILGQCRVIPLFVGEIVNPGQNAIFNLHSFAGIRIVHVDFTGGTKRLRVERCDTSLNGGTGDYSATITKDTTVFAPLTLIE